MNQNNITMGSGRRTAIHYLIVAAAMLFAGHSFAQGDGARFYWKGLMGTNAVPLIHSSIGGNANPLDPSHAVVPGAEFSSTTNLVGYAKMLPLRKRAAMVSVMAPMGRMNGTVDLNGLDYSRTARGFGDPMLQVSVNVLGPKAIMNIPDMLRYEPGFSVDLMGTLCIPVGEYDNTTPLNIGQNRWYGRIGAPVVWQLGDWVPGRRTTFELLPVVWIFGDNTDFVGKTMSTEPMYQIEGHLTRDLMEKLWVSFDAVSYTGGKATIDGVAGSELDNLGLGGTVGYTLNSNMQLNLAYSSTVDDGAPEDLKMDGFRFTLIFGWHKLVEGMQRLGAQGHH
jgi:hypothetical protein